MDELIEELAALEHKQWAHWTYHMLNNLTSENIRRWQRQVATPYKELSEEEKNSDREWAYKVLNLLQLRGWKICREARDQGRL